MLMGNRIPALLAEREWSIYKLAKESGLAYGTVHALYQEDEIPKTIYYGTLRKIARTLGVNVEDLENGD